MPKGIGIGILTGVIVWSVLFLPIHFFVMQPALSGMASGLNLKLDSSVAEQLLELSNSIIVGSFALHILFGGLMGFCFRLAVI